MMVELTLPSWLSGPKNQEWLKLYQAWWAQVKTWISETITQIDPETCGEEQLNLLAWERHVERFYGEPLALYRLRVKYAFVNAVDAGSVAGIQRIFERLGIGYVEVLERQPDKDWDVIILQISNKQLSDNQDLLKRLLTKYGRTCRRYEFNGIAAVKIGVSANHFGHQYRYHRAE